MARPKSYDRQKAVEKACMAFWENGYQALGVRELELLTGLSKYAIRTEFSGKEGLYLEALKLYRDSAILNVLPPLKEGGITEISQFFENLVTEGSMTSSSWGCLIVNTGIENARIKSEYLTQAAQCYWDALQQHFKHALDNACTQGQISPDLDRLSNAKALVSAVMGIHAKNRTTASHKGGRDLVDLIIAYLKSLRKP